MEAGVAFGIGPFVACARGSLWPEKSDRVFGADLTARDVALKADVDQLVRLDPDSVGRDALRHAGG